MLMVTQAPCISSADAAVSISNNVYWPHSFRRESGVKPMPIEQVESRYYLRIGVADEPGVLARVAGCLADHQISIARAPADLVQQAGIAPLESRRFVLVRVGECDEKSAPRGALVVITTTTTTTVIRAAP